MALLLQKAEAEYRLHFKRPEKVVEFWAAMRFELAVGKFDLAAFHLKGLLEKQPADEVDKELLKIEEAEGLFAFLRLQTIRKWSDHPPFQKEAKQNVETLINRVTNALEKLLSDPQRINKFIRKLDAPTPEERVYAFVQLNRSKARAVPYLIKALQESVDQPLHGRLVDALIRLDPETVPAYLEVLKARNAKDAAAPDLRLTLLEILKARGDKRAIPYLWHLSSSPRYPAVVRRQARDLLAYLRNEDPDRLPPAKAVLADLADRYYRHQVKFPDPKRIQLWLWTGQVIATEPLTLPPAQAEELFGLRYAREALDLDPAYVPAQTAFLNMTLDRTYAPQLDEAFFKKMPAGLHQLLGTLDSDLLMAVLERALIDRNPRVILPLVETLGERGEVRAARLSYNEPPRGLVKALYYPDRRVQYAAVRAMLRMPASPVPVASVRIVDVLRRFLAAEATPRVLVAFTPLDRADQMRKTVRAAGFEPVLVNNVRDAFLSLQQAADFDAILVFGSADRELPFALTQFRSDHDNGLLPLVVFAEKKQMQRLGKTTAHYRNTWVVPEIVASMPDELKATLEEKIQLTGGAKLSPKERKEFTRVAMDLLWRMARDEIRGYDVRPAREPIVQALRSEDLAVEALEIMGRLPGADVQQKLAAVVLDPARGKLRLTAAQELIRHIQKFGLTLEKRQAKDLNAAFQNAAESPELRTQLALVMGSLRPTARQTGNRLFQFQPEPPPPPKK
jgi:hypothetical protein